MKNLLLLTIIIVLVAASSFTTTIDATLTASQTTQLRNDLQFYKSLLQNSIDDANVQLANTAITTCTIDKVACNPAEDVATFNFRNFIPASAGFVQLKQWHGQNYTNMMQQSCALQRLGTKWLANYNQSNNQILYQYMALTNEFAAFYPMSNWSSTECASPTYTPSKRPWYTGATGKRDVVILIDNSNLATESDNAWRLATAKSVAKEIVSSLSYRDFVSIVAYNVEADQSVTINSQATEARVSQLLSAIDEINLAPSGKGQNIGNAIQYAFTIYDRSRALGLTSDCTKTIVLLSSGLNSVPVPPAGEPFSSKPEIILFPFLISQNVNITKTTLMRQLACATRSVTRTIDGNNFENITKWSVMTDYFAKLVSSSVIRASEIYTDYILGVDILSLSAPIFKVENRISTLLGVISVDILKGSLDQNGALSTTDINSYNLANQVCSPLQQRSSQNDPIIDAIQNGTCDGLNLDEIGYKTSATGKTLQITRSMPAIITVSVLAMIFLPFGMYALGQRTSQIVGYGRINMVVVVLLSVGLFICMLICVCVMFTGVSDDLVRYYNFVKVNVQLVSVEDNPYRCCEVTSCSYCSESSAASCSSEISRLTANVTGGAGPFECGNGYYCCREVCSSCNCHDVCTSSTDSDGRSSESCSQQCDTCCDCVQDVDNLRCEIGCGTCYRMVTNFVYRYNNENLKSRWEITCSLRGSAACRQNWINEHPVPSSRPGWVDPESPLYVARTNEPEKPRYAAFIVFAVFSLILTIGGYGYILRIRYADCRSVCPAKPASSFARGEIKQKQVAEPEKMMENFSAPCEDFSVGKGDNVSYPPGTDGLKVQPVYVA